MSMARRKQSIEFGATDVDDEGIKANEYNVVVEVYAKKNSNYFIAFLF